MKISTRLLLGFSAVIILMLGIGIISQYLNNQIKSQVVQESNKAVQKLELSGNMGTDLHQSLINAHYYLEDEYKKEFSNTSTDTILRPGNVETRIDAAFDSFEQNLSEFELLLDAQVKENSIAADSANSQMLHQLDRRVDIYHSLIEQLLRLTEDDYNKGQEFFTVTIEPYFRNNILPLTDELAEQTQLDLNEEIDQLNEQLTSSSQQLGMATVAALLIALGFAYLLYRSIDRPLQKISSAVQRIGIGNLDERIGWNSNDEIGKLAQAFDTMAENLGKTTVSKDFMDDIIDSMADALIVTDTDHQVSRINAAAENMLGYDDAELIGQSVTTILTESDAQDLARNTIDYEFKNFETEFICANDSTVPVAVSRAVITGAEQEIKGAVIVAADISARQEAARQIKESLREKEILLAEIHHRVKNNLALISGLLQMQQWEAEDQKVKFALTQSQLRVQSIALVHKKLYQSESFSYIKLERYIPELIEAIEQNFAISRQVQVQLDLQPVILNINQAIPCSLLINELMINLMEAEIYSFNVELGTQNKQVWLRIFSASKLKTKVNLVKK